MNKLYYGDNLDVLRKFVRDEDEILTNKGGVQTVQSLALISGLEKSSRQRRVVCLSDFNFSFVEKPSSAVIVSS